MEKLTAANLVHQLGLLPKNTSFNYIHSSTPTEIRIVNIVRPEGPISIKRILTITVVLVWPHLKHCMDEIVEHLFFGIK